MSSKNNDDELAYGDYNNGSNSASGEKSLMGSFYRKFTGKQENERPSDQQAVSITSSVKIVAFQII